MNRKKGETEEQKPVQNTWWEQKRNKQIPLFDTNTMQNLKKKKRRKQTNGKKYSDLMIQDPNRLIPTIDSSQNKRSM